MPDSDWSDSGNEEIIKKHRHKKSKHINDRDRKRRRSSSAGSIDIKKLSNEKTKLKSREGDFNDSSTMYKNNPDKYTKKEYKDFTQSRSNKRESKNNPALLESDSDKEKQKKVKKKRSLKDKYEKPHSEDNVKESKTKPSKRDLDDGNKSHSDRKRKGYNSFSGSDDEKRNHRPSGPAYKQSKYDKIPNIKKTNYEKTVDDESKIVQDEKVGDYRRTTEGKEMEQKVKYSEKDNKKSSNETVSGRRSKKDEDNTLFEKHDKRSSRPIEEDDDRTTNSSEKPYRYWSNSRPVRKNSDSYWNKYSDRLKEPSVEPVEVGPRYYSSGENLKKKIDVNDSSKDKQKDHIDIERKTPKDPEPPKTKKTLDLLTSRTGGAYIPPAKLRMMQESITDKASAAYQRLAWEALKKSIQGHVNKVNTSNIRIILKAVQKENLVRGRGLLCRALVQAQAASPSFTNVYAAFVAVLNAKFPKVGELLLKRLVVQFRRGFKRNDKTICITAATFVAHLVNQEVAHEILALEILTLLLETPTDDSVEVAIAFMKECGMKLTEVANKGVMGIFDLLRSILHEGKVEKRVQYMIEVMFQIRKEDFKAHPSVLEELDLVSEEDRIQHMITLEDNHDAEDILNVFKFDPDYEANEARYKSLVDLDSDDEDEEGGSSGSGDSDDESGDEDEEGGAKTNDIIVDKTETNLVALRKTIYLTIQSSLDFEECAHKLLRMELKPGQEIEMAHMFLDCCAEQRTYEKFFGLLAQRFCQINRMYIAPFEETFRDSYATIHRMTNDKLRNVAKLFAHLLYTDAISWDVMAIIRLNEDDTTSSSRIFIKILFLELSEYMGLTKLNQRVKDPSLQTALDGLFPRDNPKHTRFAINFFTSIGLGGLTDELREHLKAQPKPSIAVPQLVEDLSSSSSSSDSSSDSSDSTDSSSESSSTDSSSSEDEDVPSKKKGKKKPTKKNKVLLTKKTEKLKSSKKRKNTPSKRKRDRS